MNDDPWKRMFAPQGLMAAETPKPGLMAPNQIKAGLLGPLISPMQIYQSLYGPGSRQRMGGHSGGLLEPGNIDLKARPQVKMPNGDTATVRSMSVSFDNGTFLIPTVSDDGRIMSEDEAIRTFQKTGRHLGRFATVSDADRYSHSLSAAQGRYYKPNGQP